MRKFLIIILCVCLICLSGCSIFKKENADTRILMDTVVTITADCSKETISQAFDLAGELEEKLSRTIKDSDIWRINNSNLPVKVSGETLLLINKSIEYSRISEGKFDITVCPVSSLYNFSEGNLPNEEDISKALKKVDYEKIKVEGDRVSLTEGSIDLGGIAKGYVADRLVAFLKEKGVKSGTVNIGGNVYCFGKGSFKVGIKKPFSNEIMLTVESGENSFVTSGIYERYIEKDGKIYHHIIDPATGYGVENDLASVTVIGKSSADCDALSTVCMLLGGTKAKRLIESIKDFEAALILRDGTVLTTSGLNISGDKITVR